MKKKAFKWTRLPVAYLPQSYSRVWMARQWWTTCKSYMFSFYERLRKAMH